MSVSSYASSGEVYVVVIYLIFHNNIHTKFEQCIRERVPCYMLFIRRIHYNLGIIYRLESSLKTATYFTA